MIIRTATAIPIGTLKMSAPAPAVARTESPASGPYATDESASEDRIGRARKIDTRSVSSAPVVSGRPKRKLVT